MGKFSGVLIATDMDGTLLSRDGSLSDGNRAAIEQFVAEGGLFTVATGRSGLGFEAVRPTIPYNAPCVLSNGAVLFDYTENRLLKADALTGDVYGTVRDMLSRFPGVGVEFHQVWRKYALNRNRIINGHLRAVGCEATDITAPEEAGPPVIKVLFVDEAELLDKLARDFQEHHGGAYRMQFSNPFMAEFQNYGINKGSGVADLAAMLGVRPERVFTAGDERNDLDMLRRFCSFAPQNADESVKAAATHPLPDCDDNAIADMIRQIGDLL